MSNNCINEGTPGNEEESIIQIYRKMPPFLRFDLLTTVEMFRDDSDFRHLARCHSKRSEPSKPFRFMDLPPELRDEIAKYDLSCEIDLYFRWSTYKQTRKVGAFKEDCPRSINLFALTRVSKQVHSETKPFIWMGKTLCFETDPFECAHDPELLNYRVHEGHENIERAVLYVQQHRPLCLSQASRVMLQCSYSTGGDIYGLNLPAMIALAERVPEASFGFQNLGWMLRAYWKEDTDSLPSFRSMGWKLKHQLSDAGFDDKARNWRMYPCLTRVNEADLMQLFTATDDKEVLDWIKNGL